MVVCGRDRAARDHAVEVGRELSQSTRDTRWASLLFCRYSSRTRRFLSNPKRRDDAGTTWMCRVLDDGDDFVPVAAVPPRLGRLLDLFKRAKGQYASCWSGEG